MEETHKQTATEIRMALRTGECALVYRKMDGEIRSTRGTLNTENIPKDKQPKGPKTLAADQGLKPDALKHPDLIHYFDTLADGWRAFWAENIQSLKVI